MTVEWPMGTGRVAELLGVPEHSVANQIRLNKIRPPLVCGRRAWAREDVLRVAHILGVDTPAIQNVCRAVPTRTTPATNDRGTIYE